MLIDALPAAMRVLVVKSSVHFRAAFAPIASQILVAKAAGPMPADPPSPGANLPPAAPPSANPAGAGGADARHGEAEGEAGSALQERLMSGQAEARGESAGHEKGDEDEESAKPADAATAVVPTDGSAPAEAAAKPRRSRKAKEPRGEPTEEQLAALDQTNWEQVRSEVQAENERYLGTKARKLGHHIDWLG